MLRNQDTTRLSNKVSTTVVGSGRTWLVPVGGGVAECRRMGLADVELLELRCRASQLWLDCPQSRSIRDFGVKLCAHHHRNTPSSTTSATSCATKSLSSCVSSTLARCSQFRKSQRWVIHGAIVTSTLANTSVGAHRSHHRRVSRCHSLWLSPSDSVPRILPQRAQAIPHPVSAVHITQQLVASNLHSAASCWQIGGILELNAICVRTPIDSRRPPLLMSLEFDLTLNLTDWHRLFSPLA